MIQRYHIARFNLSIWKFGVFDEPTNGLDEDGIEVLNEAFKEFKEKNDVEKNGELRRNDPTLKDAKKNVKIN